MKQVSLIILSCLLLLPAGMKAEDDMPKQWTLRNCIDYALEHNITIRRNRISVESTQEDVKTAKADFLPSLSGNISQRIVNRPNNTSGTIISGDNITTSESKTSYNGSYGIDASWTVYNGSKRVNTVKQQQLNSRIAELTVDQSENSIEENITQLYVQILYSAEAVKVNESTLEVSRKEFERGQQLFDAGSIASSDLAQLEAQVSNDNYQLVTAQTTLQNYKLQLKQLLELDGDFEMDLFLPQLDDSSVLIPLPTKDDVYQTALNLRPEIEYRSFRYEHQDSPCRLHPDLKPERRDRNDECQRQRLQFQRTGQTELEQLDRIDPEHSHLRQTADQKYNQQGQATDANQPTGSDGRAENALQNHRKPLAECQQRPTAIRSRHPKAEKYTGQLRPRQRTVQPGYEEYRRTAHRKEQPVERTAGNASGQIHSHTQCRPAALLSGRRNQSALSHQ